MRTLLLALLLSACSQEVPEAIPEQGAYEEWRGVLHDNWKYITLRYSDYIVELSDGLPLTHWTSGQGGTGLEHDVATDYPNYFDRDQLYSLEIDPDEQMNLFDDPQYADILEGLSGRLREFVQSLPGEYGEFTN